MTCRRPSPRFVVPSRDVFAPAVASGLPDAISGGQKPAHFPLQALLAFITFVRAAGTMPLRLGYLLHMHQYRHMLFPAYLYRFFIRFAQMWIIPTPCFEDLITLSAIFSLETFQNLADARRPTSATHHGIAAVHQSVWVAVSVWPATTDDAPRTVETSFSNRAFSCIFVRAFVRTVVFNWKTQKSPAIHCPLFDCQRAGPTPTKIIDATRIRVRRCANGSGPDHVPASGMKNRPTDRRRRRKGVRHGL